jgi:hypothetical protein
MSARNNVWSAAACPFHRAVYLTVPLPLLGFDTQSPGIQGQTMHGYGVVPSC